MTVSTLRPSSTAVNTGSVSGSSAHAALSDSSDSTFVVFDPSETATLGLGDLSLPAGAVITALAMRLRHDGILRPVVTAWLEVAPVSLSRKQVVTWGTPTTMQMAARELDYADAAIDAAVLHLDNGVGDGGSGWRVYAAYVDVTYVVQPVVNALSPTSTISGNVPSVEWEHTTLDDDGGEQTHFEVRVFTDDQYGAGGFNPASSTATAESGEVESSDLSWDIDEAPLANDTYRAYVRVAQTVKGEQLWSAFDYVQFTVSATRPGLPQIALTADDDNARVQIDLTASGSGATTDLFEVQRSDDGGASWQTIRTLESSGFIDAADTTVFDYEAPNGVEVTYRVRARTLADSPAVTAWVSDEVTWESVRQWIKSASVPSLNVAVTFLSQPGHDRAVRRGVFQPLGRADAIAITDTRGPATGELKILVDEDDLETFAELLDTGLPVFVQAPSWHKWPDRWVSFGDESATRLTDKAWSAEDNSSLSWVAVTRLDDPLAAWE